MFVRMFRMWQFVTRRTSIVPGCYYCVTIVTPQTLTRHLKTDCAAKCQNNNHIRHKLFYYFSHRFCPEFFNTFEFFSRCHTKYIQYLAGLNVVSLSEDDTGWRWSSLICWQRPSCPPLVSSNMLCLCFMPRTPLLVTSTDPTRNTKSFPPSLQPDDDHDILTEQSDRGRHTFSLLR